MSDSPALPSSVSQTTGYSLPLDKAHFKCPQCRTPIFFKTKPDNRGASYHGRLMRCDGCGRVVGRYLTTRSGMVLLQAAVITEAVDAALPSV